MPCLGTPCHRVSCRAWAHLQHGTVVGLAPTFPGGVERGGCESKLARGRARAPRGCRDGVLGKLRHGVGAAARQAAIYFLLSTLARTRQGTSPEPTRISALPRGHHQSRRRLLATAVVAPLCPGWYPQVPFRQVMRSLPPLSAACSSSSNVLSQHLPVTGGGLASVWQRTARPAPTNCMKPPLSCA
jgi:hypothetical protein